MSIPIDISEQAGIRYLHFGSEWVQGAMRIRKPWALELAYTREMMMGLLLHPVPRKVLLIGLGAGSLAKFVHRQLPQARCTVIEIAPEVHAVAQQYFKLPENDARFQVLIGDGAEYVMQHDAHWDLIAVDGYDRHACAGDLTTLPFYQACWSRLSERGLLVANLFGGSRGLKSTLGHISTAFDGRSLTLPAVPSGNVIALAARGQAIELSRDELFARATLCAQTTGLDLEASLLRLERAGGLAEGFLRL